MTCTVSGAIMLSVNRFINRKSSPSTLLSYVLDGQFVVKYTPADCLPLATMLKVGSGQYRAPCQGSPKVFCRI